VPGRRDHKEESLGMPVSAREHACALNENDEISLWRSSGHHSVIEVQVVECDEKDALEHQPLHFCEQYLTLSHSRAHFLRHSNGSPQRSQVLGANPFFVWAVRDIL
jgi:hypothetical protein